MYFDQDRQEMTVQLKGKSAVIVIALLAGWFVFSGFYTTRKANADHTGAAESIELFLQSRGARLLLPDGGENFDTSNQDNVNALLSVGKLKVDVQEIRGGLTGRKIVKAEVGLEGQRRIAYYRIKYSSLTGYWDSTSIWECNETVYNWCAWR